MGYYDDRYYDEYDDEDDYYNGPDELDYHDTIEDDDDSNYYSADVDDYFDYCRE